MLRGPPAGYACLGPMPRNGLSLPRGLCPLPGLLHGINDPGLLLRLPAKSSPSPFGSRLLRLYRFAPVPGGIHAVIPLPEISPSRLNCASNLRSPLGFFVPSGSTLRPASPLRSPPSEKPDFPSLPGRVDSFESRPDRRSRPATSLPAAVPWYLLEPST